MFGDGLHAHVLAGAVLDQLIRGGDERDGRQDREHEGRWNTPACCDVNAWIRWWLMTDFMLEQALTPPCADGPFADADQTDTKDAGFNSPGACPFADGPFADADQTDMKGALRLPGTEDL